MRFIQKIFLLVVVLSAAAHCFEQKCGYGYIQNGDSCETCGNSSYTPNVERIVGGVIATAYSWPSQVFIVQNVDVTVTLDGVNYSIKQSFICGGTIISHNTILTAAHCIVEKFEHSENNIIYEITLEKPFDPEMYAVYVAAYDISFFTAQQEPTAPTVRMEVKKVIRYPGFTDNDYLNDIALYVLSKPIEFNKYVQPACLPVPASTLQDNTPVFVAGWGTLYEGSQSNPSKLYNVRLTSYNPSYCQNVVSSVEKNWNSQMCAGEYNGGKDSCQGDSGGGLYAYDTTLKKYIVHGIVSYGEGCANYAKPGIYTRVSHYYNWITSNWEINGGGYTTNLNFTLFTFVLISTLFLF